MDTIKTGHFVYTKESKNVLPDEGSFVCPPGKLRIFCKKKANRKKIKLVATTWRFTASSSRLSTTPSSPLPTTRPSSCGPSRGTDSSGHLQPTMRLSDARNSLQVNLLFKNIQSPPIKMRTPILYLANHWTKFKMLLKSNRFLYLIRFLLLSFPLIPQFIAQFRSICLFLCSSPYFLPVATK